MRKLGGLVGIVGEFERDIYLLGMYFLEAHFIGDSRFKNSAYFEEPIPQKWPKRRNFSALSPINIKT